jgi:hypothetical protein
VALGETNELATVLGPTLGRLRPFARRLEAVNLSLGRTARETYGPLKDEIRPFVQVARKPVRDLRPAAASLANATPRLTVVGQKLNKLFNMAAYNPNGAEDPGTAGRDEGYLYWVGWLSHLGNSTFANQDAHGVYRNLYLTATCDSAAALLAETPLNPLVTGLQQLFDVGGPFAGGCG